MWAAITGFIQALFLSFFILRTDRGIKKVNYLLAAYLAVMGAYLIIPHLVRSNLTLFPHLIGVSYPLLFLTGPILYLYTSILLSPDNKIPVKYYYHFLPAILVFVWLSDFYFKSAEEKLIRFSNIRQNGLSLDFTIIWAFACLHIISYLYTCYTSAKQYNLSLKDNFSSTIHVNIKWLENFSFYNLLLWCIYAVGYLLVLLKVEYDPYGLLDQFFTIILASYIYFLSYTALAHPDLFPTPLMKAPKSVGKEKISLTEDEKVQYRHTIDHIIIEKKTYLSPELTLQELSSITQIPARLLSVLIRDLYCSNFYDFINSYRVNEVKLRLRNPSYDHLTIASIAYDCGFNSKTSFNEAFKKNVQMTPKEFKKMVQ